MRRMNLMQAVLPPECGLVFPPCHTLIQHTPSADYICMQFRRHICMKHSVDGVAILVCGIFRVTGMARASLSWDCQVFSGPQYAWFSILGK